MFFWKVPALSFIITGGGTQTGSLLLKHLNILTFECMVVFLSCGDCFYHAKNHQMWKY